MMVIFLRRRGIRLSRTTVLKYMRELKLRSVVIPKKSRYRKGDCYKKFNNLLKQDFTAIRPNEKWCTDFTYLYLSDGAKRYNCSIIDLYDKSVLATLNSKRIDAELAIQTLQIALDRNPVKGKIILHSDQGSQYTSRAFTEFCEGKGIRQSMSKAGCPYDNSPMESFYGTCLTISVFPTCLAPVTRITLKKSLSFKNLRSSSRVIYFITHLRIFMKIYD